MIASPHTMGLTGFDSNGEGKGDDSVKPINGNMFTQKQELRPAA